MTTELVGNVNLSITIDGQRNTFTVDRLLVQLMGIRLGMKPNTKESSLAVRDWLEQRFVERPPPVGEKSVRPGYAKWARFYLITEIGDPELLKQWRQINN